MRRSRRRVTKPIWNPNYFALQRNRAACAFCRAATAGLVPGATLRVPGALPRYAARFPTFLYIAGAIAL